MKTISRDTKKTPTRETVSVGDAYESMATLRGHIDAAILAAVTAKAWRDQGIEDERYEADVLEELAFATTALENMEFTMTLLTAPAAGADDDTWLERHAGSEAAARRTKRLRERVREAAARRKAHESKPKALPLRAVRGGAS